MANKIFTEAELLQLVSSLPENAGAVQGSLDDLQVSHSVINELEWQPNLLARVGDDWCFVHVLATRSIPEYVSSSAALLSQVGTFRLLAIAPDLIDESSDERKVSVPAAYVAGAVAQKCQELGIGLSFIQADKLRSVFPARFVVPVACENATELGHIPSFILEKLAKTQGLSPYFKKKFKLFARDYTAATAKSTLDYDQEVDLLSKFVKDLAGGDRRLYFPFGQLEVLREWERNRANKNARDHFFHTFNNLFMGFYILGSLSEGQHHMAEIDATIERDEHNKSTLYEWEALWMQTCLFHDPAYTAENFQNGTFRFSFGVFESDTDFGAALSTQHAANIEALWDTEFAVAREDLRQLYARTIRRWLPPSISPAPSPDVFDKALRHAYFDGTSTSHSLISGLRLIQQCKNDKTVKRAEYDKDTALLACEIAALGMLFHDPRCRAILCEKGIAPVAFKRLPYAATLMFVDSLQEDRRNITTDRFNVHGVLADLDVDSQNRLVKAAVCLRELPHLRLWSGKIAEFEDVLNWIGANSGVKFEIDYRA
jgi:hypothetical protein